MESNRAAAAVDVAPSIQLASSLRVFATCPSSTTAPDRYPERVAAVARWSERAGCTGILVYTDNSLVDPWLVSQIILENTETLSPLVAVQPVYMHPYSVAKMVATMGFLYGRRIFLNMVAGGFKNDLIALHDATPHDDRYHRLVEYTAIIQQLLEARSPVTFDGQFYKVTGLTLSPRLAPELCPGIMVSGSSDAGMAAARQMGATAVRYPEPPGPGNNGGDRPSAGESCGVRIGIIARATRNEAWAEAHQRFPEDRKGQLTRQLATKVSDSAWHKRLAAIDKQSVEPHGNGTYWLHPFDNYQTNCPYLVGSYDDVAEDVAGYIRHGYHTFILDIPPTEEELDHIGIVFQSAASFRPGSQGASL